MAFAHLIWSSAPAAIGYGLSAWQSWQDLRDQQSPNQDNRRSEILLLLSLIYQACVFAAYAFSRQSLPLASMPEVLLGTAWLIGLGQWICQRRIVSTSALSFLSMIPTLIACLGALIMGTVGWDNEFNRSSLFVLHIALSTTAISFLSVGSVLCLMYFLLDRRLRRKQFDTLFHNLPPLHKVERMTLVWHKLALLASLIVMVLGFWWRWSESPTPLPLRLWITSILPVLLLSMPILANHFGILRQKALIRTLIMADLFFIINILVKVL